MVVILRLNKQDSERTVRMDWNRFQTYAKSLGFVSVGAIPVEELLPFRTYIRGRMNTDYSFYEKLAQSPFEGASPKEIWPDARSVVVLIWDYYQAGFPEELENRIGSLYLSRCYKPTSEMPFYEILRQIKQFLTEEGCQITDQINIPSRFAALRAGLVSIGKNGFAYSKETGSFCVIITIVTDQELSYRRSDEEEKCPENCAACLKACPTGALFEPYQIHPDLCINYFTNMGSYWEDKDLPGFPEELLERTCGYIFGCNICQNVCPRNRNAIEKKKPADPFTANLVKDLTLGNLLHMDEGFFRNKVLKLMHSGPQDKRYFQRSAAVAMGISGDIGYLPDLNEAAESHDPMIRRYALWAIKYLKKTGKEEK